MKKIICILTVLVMALNANAQLSKIPQRLEIAIVEDEENGTSEFEVFNSPKDGKNAYWLSVGHLGFGDEVVQVLFDPAFELFLPLGSNLTEALANLQRMQELLKQAPGTEIELIGCLAFGFPNDKFEVVKVSHRKALLSHSLMFSVEREGYIRATDVPKSQFGSLVSGVKFYSKLHKKER